MYASTRSAVRGDGERPARTWCIRFGSHSALGPKAVGLGSIWLRNAFTGELNSLLERHRVPQR